MAEAEILQTGEALFKRVGCGGTLCGPHLLGGLNGNIMMQQEPCLKKKHAHAHTSHTHTRP